MKPKKWLYFRAIHHFTQDALGLTSHNIWQSIEDDEYLMPFGDTHNFNFKKQVFLDFIRYALENGLMKLGKYNEFLTGTIDCQIEKWQKTFPKSESKLLSDDGMFYEWFFMPDCPAGFVWLHPLDNGSIYENWT